MRLGALALALVALAGCSKPTEKSTLRVAAAADLTKTFADIGKAYEAKTQKKVVFSFAASGTLEKQLEARAPFDVFAAANVAFVDAAIQSGACLASSKVTYAVGALGMWTRAGAPHPADIVDLANPIYAKIAIANPEHAPYGKAAKQALAKAGLWERVSSKLVYGENVQQALEFARSGNADVAFVRFAPGGADGASVRVDPALHDPLEQAIAVCHENDGPPRAGADAFVAFVVGPDGKAILQRDGFSVRDR